MRKAILLTLLFLTLFTQYDAVTTLDKNYMAFIESYLSRGVSWTDDSRYINHVDMVYWDGHFYSDKLPILPLYSAIALKPFHLFLKFDSDAQAKILYYLATWMTGGLSALLLCGWFIKAYRQFRTSGTHENIFLATLLFATCVMPYFLIYTSYAPQTALIFGSFYFMTRAGQAPKKRYSIYAGLLNGLAIAMHPFAGVITAFCSTIYFLKIRFMDAWRFVIGIALMIVVGLAVNYQVNGMVTPFYFKAEAYLYAFRLPSLPSDPNTPRFQASTFLHHLNMGGLSEELIVRRLNELQVPELIPRSLERFRQHQEKITSPIKYAVSMAVQYDYLTFNPCVVFCLLLLVRSLFSRAGPYRKEILWSLAVTVLLYIAAIKVRAHPGWVYGNRYLIPVIPPMFLLAAVLLREKDKELDYFKLLFPFCLGVALIATYRTDSPWQIPKSGFSHPVIAANILIDICSAFYVFSPKWRAWLHPWVAAAVGSRLTFGGMIVLFFTAAFILNFGSDPGAFLSLKMAFYPLFFAALIMFWGAKSRRSD